MRKHASAISVLVADASRMSCQLMTNALIQSSYSIGVCALAVNSAEVQSAVEKWKPEIAVIGGLKDGPNTNLKITRELSASGSKTNAVILIEPDMPTMVIDALRAGAHGVVCRDDPFEMLCKCIYVVHQGQIWLTDSQLQCLLDHLAQVDHASTGCGGTANPLTNREESIVHLVAEGLTNREISHELNLSEHTVRNYLFRIFDKLGTSSRLELAVFVNRRQGHQISEGHGGAPGSGAAPS